jgi:predicted homoserine dehydrogenase-like protein
LPYYLAVGGRVRRTVRKCQPLCWGDVDLPPDSILLRLRQAQDDRFLRP